MATWISSRHSASDSSLPTYSVDNSTEVESLRTELREIKAKLESWAGTSPIDRLDRLILQWEERANWGREQALKRESAERELREMREALEYIFPYIPCSNFRDELKEKFPVLSRKGEGS